MEISTGSNDNNKSHVIEHFPKCFTLSHLILKTNLWSKDFYYPHFAAESLRHRGKELSSNYTASKWISYNSKSVTPDRQTLPCLTKTNGGMSRCIFLYIIVTFLKRYLQIRNWKTEPDWNVSSARNCQWLYPWCPGEHPVKVGSW